MRIGTDEQPVISAHAKRRLLLYLSPPLGSRLWIIRVAALIFISVSARGYILREVRSRYTKFPCGFGWPEDDAGV